MLARGLGSPGDCAELIGVSRQAVESWARVAGIDWRKAYQARLVRDWARLQRNGAAPPPRPSKAELRKRADRAKATWDWRNAIKP